MDLSLTMTERESNMNLGCWYFEQLQIHWKKYTILGNFYPHYRVQIKIEK